MNNTESKNESQDQCPTAIQTQVTTMQIQQQHKHHPTQYTPNSNNRKQPILNPLRTSLVMPTCWLRWKPRKSEPFCPKRPFITVVQFIRSDLLAFPRLDDTRTRDMHILETRGG